MVMQTEKSVLVMARKKAAGFPQPGGSNVLIWLHAALSDVQYELQSPYISRWHNVSKYANS